MTTGRSFLHRKETILRALEQARLTAATGCMDTYLSHGGHKKYFLSASSSPIKMSSYLGVWGPFLKVCFYRRL